MIEANMIKSLKGVKPYNLSSSSGFWETYSITDKFFILLRISTWYHYKFFARKEIRVDDIFVHESFNLTLDQVQANDIALLRLGEYF